MHLAIVFAVLLLCLFPFAFQTVERQPLKRKRLILGLVLTNVQFLFLAYYVLSIACCEMYGSMPTLELTKVYSSQMRTLLPQLMVELLFSLVVLVATWLVLAWLYSRAAPVLLSSLESLGQGAQPSSIARQGNARVRMGILLFIGLLFLVYLPTRRYWLRREPIHTFWGATTAAGVIIPENLRSGRSSQENAYLAGLPRDVRPSTPRNLILITVDALRSDLTGVYGAAADDTPFLSSLYRTGKLRRIDSAYSICTFSFCGILGTLSSSYWHQLSGSSLVLPDLLTRYGYQTRFLLSGDHTRFLGLRSFYGSHITEFRDGSTTDHARLDDDRIILPWLQNVSWSSPHGTFLNIHLMSAHFAGERQPQFERWKPDTDSVADFLSGVPKSQRYRNHYLNGILQTDDIIRQIFQVLSEKGVLDQALVIITADHGEYLGETGKYGHGYDPYEPQVRIPILIYDQSAAAYPLRSLTSQVDIAPTFLYAIGVPIPPEWSGIPLQLPTTRNAISIASHEASGVIAQLGARRYKYLRRRESGLEELYDLGAPDAEKTNLASQPAAQPALVQMRALHQQILQQNGAGLQQQ